MNPFSRFYRLLPLAFVSLATSILAQNRPPALLVGEGKAGGGLAVTKVEVDSRIYGFIAETRMTLVFRNNENRVLAGDLVFPLPPGATVSGYALDVNGTLVDGVAVGKDKGREVFEKEMRKGVDPGLAEWTRGNQFRTRVFPIPARGTRTVRLSYLSELAPGPQGNQYRLPLHFTNALASFHLRVEVIKAPAQPVLVKGAPRGMQFGKWRDSYVAETTRTNAPVSGELVIDLPKTDQQRVLVEKGSDGALYYCLSETPADPRPGRKQTAADEVSQVTLFWDASGSRGGTNHQREIAFLKSWFAAQKNPVTVNFVPFRHVLGSAQTFPIRNGDLSPLLAALNQVEYDGATQLGCLTNFPAQGAACYFLFSDGLGNFGKAEPPRLEAPLWVFSASQTLDEPLLQNLAQTSGGAFFPLRRLTDQQVLAGMANRPFTFLGPAPGFEAAADLYPQLPRPLAGRLVLAGKVRSPNSRLTLNYGVGRKTLVQSTIALAASDAAAGDLLRRFWAQKKLQDLLVFQKRNEEPITELGKQFSLVTPFTSLIVLETVQQYVEHRILPPASLPAVRAEYARMVEQLGATEKKTESEKLARLAAMWKQRTEWWDKEFSYPKDFRYSESQEKRPSYLTPLPGSRAGYVTNSVIEAPNEAAPASAAEPVNPALVDFAAAPMNQSVAAVPSRIPRVSAGRSQGPAPEPGIAVREWDPKTPYITALKNAPTNAWRVYLTQRAKYATSPAFYLDCAEFFRRQKQADQSIQVLSNIAELDLENPPLLRVLAYRLLQLGRVDFACDLFERIRVLRPEEPQSYRDLALALAARGKANHSSGDYRRALELLTTLVKKNWDRFDEIEVIGLMELNAMWDEYLRQFPADKTAFPLPDGLKRLLDLDVRIVLTWDADMTDMDLHIVEPSGERAFYGHNLTRIGGLVSRDFTQGYGPEEYCLRRAMRGTYKIEVNYYGSRAVTLMGPVTVQAEVITNFGRPNEKRRNVTLRLESQKESILVGEVEF